MPKHTLNELLDAMEPQSRRDKALIGRCVGNVFTDAERRLLFLFYADIVADTIDTLHQALDDIFDPEDRAAAKSLISKLDGMDRTSGIDAILESEGLYVG